MNPFNQEIFVPMLIEMSRVALEEKNCKCYHFDFAITLIHSLINKTWSFEYILKIELPLPKNALCQVVLNGSNGSVEDENVNN